MAGRTRRTASVSNYAELLKTGSDEDNDGEPNEEGVQRARRGRRPRNDDGEFSLKKTGTAWGAQKKKRREKKGDDWSEEREGDGGSDSGGNDSKNKLVSSSGFSGMRGPPKKREVSVVILDIEGTTTPITFVRDNLFGFVREHLLEYVQTQGPTNPSVLAAMTHYGAPDAPSLVPSILSAMDRDEKTPALKRLQSDIMDSGWKDGSLQAVVYDDVVTSLRNWSQTKTSVAIYSSGAISAQKALYGHVKGHGSLLHLLAAHYDPATVGPKTQAASYAAIKALWGGNTNRNQILFLTDNPQEASAAVEAGLFCVLVSRPGNAELPQFPPVSVIQSFDVLWDMYEFVPTKSEAIE